MTDTQHLIKKVERNERRYRVVQTIFMIAILAILSVVLYDNSQLQQANQQLLKNQTTILKQQAATAKTESDNVNAKLDQQTKVILCLAGFFAIPNRTNLTIDNVNSCAIGRPGSTPLSMVLPPASTPQSTAPTHVTPTTHDSQSQNQNTAAAGSQQPTPSPKPTFFESTPVVGGLFKGLGL